VYRAAILLPGKRIKLCVVGVQDPYSNSEDYVLFKGQPSVFLRRASVLDARCLANLSFWPLRRISSTIRFCISRASQVFRTFARRLMLVAHGFLVLDTSAVPALLLRSRLNTVGGAWLSWGFVRFRKGMFFLGEPVADALFTDAVISRRLIRVGRTYEFSTILILPGCFAGLACVDE
jgi:hypothetical protein